MLTQFELAVPTKILFGRGRIAEAGRVVGGFGDRAFVVTGRQAMRKSGALDRLVGILSGASVGVEFFSVSPNPRSDEVDRASDLAGRRRCDVVVGFGGGSALDAAKAVAVGVAIGPVGPFVGTEVAAPAGTLPVVAIPTTAGSGSEVTKGAIITDVGRGLKAGIRGSCLFPRAAIIDPALTTTLSPEIAVETAFDALAHGVESYLARAANPFTDLVAEKVIQTVGARLACLAKGDTDAAARDELSFAALLGGINVANASTCLPHRLQQAMGGVKPDVSHGRGLSALYPSWLRHAHPFASARLDHVAGLLGGGSVHGALLRLIEEGKLPSNLTSLGITADDIPTMLTHVTGNLVNDPIEPVDGAVLDSIYRGAL
jgi:alcohol dehydrogenase